MKHVLGLVLVLAVGGVAVAKPLPAGLKISFANGKLTATQDGATVTLTSVKAKKLVTAELSDDGKTIKVKLDGIPVVTNEIGEEEIDDGLREYGLGTVEAQLANSSGMGLSIKKKYADAIPHFTRAVQKDPDAPVYLTNLLSAQSLAGKLDDADAVIAQHGKRIAPWLAWRLIVDGDLKALVGRPSAKLGAKGTGKAKGDLFDKVAYSPLGFAAVELVTNASMGDGSGPTDFALAFVDLKTGKQVLTLPTETKCQRGCKPSPAKRAVADKVLAMLDFDQLPDGYKNAVNEDEVASKDGRKLDIKNGQIIAGGKKIKLPDELPQIWGVAFVPKAVVLETREKNGDFFEIGLVAIPTP
jgi:hypothetical protein